MADTTNLSQFLSDVADAIRTKKETTEQIPAENFDQEILSIETGIDTSDATATASDIVVDKTAYVNNTKLTGTIQTLTKDDAPYMLPTTHPSYSAFGSSTLVSNAPEYGDYLYLTNGNYGNVGYVIEFPINILPVDIRGKNILIRYFKDYIVGYDWIDFCVTEYTNSFKGSYHDGTYNILCVDENGTSANFTYYYYTQQNLTFDSITPDSWTLSTSAPSGKSNKQNGYSYSTKKVISTSNSSLVLIPASEDYKFIVKTNVGTSGLKKYVKDEAVLDTKINTTELAEKAGLTSDKILEGNTILGIEGTAEAGTKINNQDKEVVENGTYTADEGYTGLGIVTVNVPSTGVDTSDATATAKDIINGKTAYVNGEKITGNIQERTAEQTPMKTAATTITENNDRNRFGMSGVPTALQTYAFRPNAKVEVEADKDKVANAIGLTPEKLVKGNTILGVEGTAETGGSGGSGDVKLFANKEEMQADTTAKEGDLAVVYRDDTFIPSVSDTISSFNPPATVIFDTAITSSVSATIRNMSARIDLSCRLTASQFYISDMYETVITDVRRILYTSSDGITYTRTDGGADTYYFGTEITLGNVNSNILKFLQSGTVVFEGLYEYGTDSYHLAPTQLTLTNPNQLLPNVVGYGKNGLITGDGSIYDNLDTDYVLSNFFGLTSYKSNAYGYIPHNLAKVNYLKRQSGGQYVLASVKQNIPYESTETHYSSIWNDAGTIEFRMIYNNFYLYDKNGNVLYDFRSDHAIISNTIDTSVVHFENDILCLLVCARTACAANSNSAFILKIDMSNGTVNDIVGDTFSINVSDYTNEVYGGYMANAGIAFVSLAAEKISSPYTQYSAVHIYDAIYDNLFYLEYVTSNSSSIGIDMIYPQIVQSQGDKLFIVLSQNGNTQSSKLYEYNRKTKISTLLSTKTSRLSLGNTSSKTIGTVIDCGGYLYTPDNHNEGQFYRYSKSSTTVPTPTETVPEPTATRFVGTRYAQGDKLYNSNTGEICTVDTSDTIPIINLVDKLAFDNYYCTVSDGSYRSYVRKEIEKITNDYVDIYGIVYTDSFKCRLTRYTEGTPDDYDVAALNVYKTTNVVQTYLLGVTGTYEPDYTELGTISPTEYDTAVATSEDILGNTTK